MQRSRKIAYNTATGDVLDVYDGDEVFDVIHETTQSEAFLRPNLLGVNPSTIGFLTLNYGERRAEFLNMGSCYVDPVTKVLTIYPRLTITTDKAQITANGTDTATITVTVQDTVSPHAISFSVNGGAPVVKNTANGVTTLSMTTTIPKDYIITATSDIYGSNSVIVKGV